MRTNRAKPAGWQRFSLFGLLAFLMLFVLAQGRAVTAQVPDPVINEFVADHIGSDVGEFVEIYGAPNTDYSNFWVIEIEGDSGSSTGQIDDGIFQVGTTDANGIWTSPYQNNVIENGNITLLLVDTFTGAVTNDIDTNDDGIIDATFWTRLVDSVGIDDENGGQVYGEANLAAFYDGAPFTPGGASRFPDGVDTDTTADWYRNNYDGDGLPCFPNCGTGTGSPAAPGEAFNTAGLPNAVQPILPVINEFVANHTGTDTHEFIEVFGTPNTDYSSYTVFEVEGEGASTGLIDDVILTVGTTDANGIWVSAYDPGGTTDLENGTLSLLLVDGFSGATGQDIDVANDGVIDATFWTNLVDGVGVHDGSAGDFTYSDTELDQNFDGGGFTVGGASRIPNGTDTDNAADWVRNDFDGDGLPCCVATADPGEALNTPGAPNAVQPNTPVINEFVANHDGTDVNEFIEIYGDPNVDYSSYTILEIEGDSTSNEGTIDGAWPVGTTDGSGFWDTGFINNDIENGTITLLVVNVFTGTVGTDLDTNDDGIIDVALPWTAVVDAVAVTDGGAGDINYGLPVLAPNFDGNAFTPGGASRIPDGTDTDTDADWVRNSFDGDGLPCFPNCGASPGDPAAAGEAYNTPGGTNSVALGGSTTLVINEVDYDQVGTDVAEFIEILNVSGGPIDLSAYTLELVNGDLGGAVVYDTIALPATSLASGDYFVVCADMLTVANCDLEALSSVQDGAPDAVALMTTVIPNLGPGIPVVVDTVSYEGDTGAPYTEGSGAGLEDDGVGAYSAISRFPNGFDTESNNTDLSPRCVTPGAANGAANTACTLPPGTIGLCFDPATFIHDVQGNGTASPLDGFADIVIEGVVVGDFQDTATELGGFFVQEEDIEADADAMTSEGIFVLDNGFGPDVAMGDVVRVQGTVDEEFGQTQLEMITSLQICASGQTVTPATITMPVADVGDWEYAEGMSIYIPEPLTASDNFNTGRYGEVRLSSDGRLYNPTNVVDPGTPANDLAAANQRRMILLDDGSNLENASPASYIAGDGTLRAGDTIPDLTGVLGYGFSLYRVHPTTAVAFTRVNERPTTVPDVGGDLTVASFNVLNYFSTIDTGPDICGPNADQDCRGADTPEEFVRQRDKIFDAMIMLDADIVGLMEIENNPFDDALQNLVNGVNSAAGSALYDLVDTGVILEGDQAIKVALIYQPATVTPLGAPAVLTDAFDPTYHDYRNRAAVAQTFIDNASGEIFTVVVNHLKSKGSDCDTDVPPDPDLGDGQANCNLTRLNGVIAQMAWLASDPTGSGDPDFLIIGDLNSYLMEDPIVALEDGGYINLVTLFGGSDVYSYVFFGEAGLLDHALGSANMTAQVTGTEVWHINADEPSALDYNNYNQPELYTPEKWRSSDHDPVVVGISLRQPTDVSLTGFSDGGSSPFWAAVLLALALPLAAWIVGRRRRPV